MLSPKSERSRSIAAVPSRLLDARIAAIRRQVISLGRAAVRACDGLAGNELILEWRQQCLNYWRCIEIPICLAALTDPPIQCGPVLDLGSPKIAALWLAKYLSSNQVIASDISPYFVDDLRPIYKALSCENATCATFDARSIPSESNSIAAAVSVSVIEHIPGDGDSAAMAELGRVLAGGGRAVISVPYWTEPLNEYAEPGSLYWESFTSRNDSKVFYQRRYSYADLVDRLIKPSGLSLKSLFLISERPLFSNWGQCVDGGLLENWQYLRTTKLTRLAKCFSTVMPSLPQMVNQYYSWQLHSFTANTYQKNAMAAVMVLEKPEIH